MVAVLSAQPELFDPNERQNQKRPQLRLVDGDVRVPGPPLRSSTRRHSLLTYWRRRVVAACLLMGLVWLIFAGTQFLLGQGKDLQPPAVQTVVESAAGDALAIGRVVIVQPGDTLWSIARGLQPTGDIRPFVDRIADLNGGHSLTAGQTLQLP